MPQNIPAPSLLLGPLRLHQIEQLLFRVDLKLGIECRACVDQGSTCCVPCYDNPGSSVGLALGSGVYAGNVINEFLG